MQVAFRAGKKREKATEKEEKGKLGCLFPRHPGRRKSKSLQR